MKRRRRRRKRISKGQGSRLSQCQAEGTDLITSSLAGPQPDGGHSWKQEELSGALLVTASPPPSDPNPPHTPTVSTPLAAHTSGRSVRIYSPDSERGSRLWLLLCVKTIWSGGWGFLQPMRRGWRHLGTRWGWCYCLRHVLPLRLFRGRNYYWSRGREKLPLQNETPIW